VTTTQFTSPVDSDILQDVDPRDVTFDGPDLQPVVIPAEKLGQGWIEVLQYLRELREQVLAGPT
jgi:hypothetical protein